MIYNYVVRCNICCLLMYKSSKLMVEDSPALSLGDNNNAGAAVASAYNAKEASPVEIALQQALKICQQSHGHMGERSAAVSSAWDKVSTEMGNVYLSLGVLFKNGVPGGGGVSSNSNLPLSEDYLEKGEE